MDNEQPEGEVTQPQPEVTEPKPEVTEPQEDLKKELDSLRRLHEQDTDRITRLKKERGSSVEIAKLEADIAYLKDAIRLQGKQQGGGFTDVGNYEQALAQLDTEYQKKRSTIEARAQYQSHVEQSAEAIGSIFTEAGIDPDSDNPEVLSLKQKWENGIRSGDRLDGIIAEATRIANKTIKASLPNEEKIREKIIKELKEKEKTGASLKVDTGTARGQVLNDADFYKAWGRGDLDNTAENKKRARAIYDKLRKGG